MPSRIERAAEESQTKNWDVKRQQFSQSELYPSTDCIFTIERSRGVRGWTEAGRSRKELYTQEVRCTDEIGTEDIEEENNSHFKQIDLYPSRDCISMMEKCTSKLNLDNNLIKLFLWTIQIWFEWRDAFDPQTRRLSIWLHYSEAP